MTDKVDLKSAIRFFTEVQKHIELNKPLPWNLTSDVLKAALSHCTAAETLPFLNDTLPKVISIMIVQNPSKLGPNEKLVVEEGLHNVLRLVILRMTAVPSLVNILGRIFDSKATIYYGTKLGYTYTPGLPQLRLQFMRKFAEQRGFERLVDMWTKEGSAGGLGGWLGGEAIFQLMSAMQAPEVSAHLTKPLVISFLSLSFDHILRTPEEVLKREQTDLLSSLVRGLAQTYVEVVGDNGGRVRGTHADESFPGMGSQEDGTCMHFLEFWYLLILRALSSSSLLLRLWGVGELGELVGEVRRLRPPARSYKVLGSGTSVINGVYNVVAEKVVAYGQGDHTLQYTKGEGDEDDPVITLFRCTMRNSKSKWWFLSQADKEKPGTDKDIDYYLHRTPADEDREPPASGWQNNHTGMRVLGVEPCPLLIRGEPFLAPGHRSEEYADALLMRWATSLPDDPLMFALYKKYYGVESAEVVSDKKETGDSPPSPLSLFSLLLHPSLTHREILPRITKFLNFVFDYPPLFKVGSKLVIQVLVRTAIIFYHDVDLLAEAWGVLVKVWGRLPLAIFKGIWQYLKHVVKVAGGMPPSASGIDGEDMDIVVEEDEWGSHWWAGRGEGNLDDWSEDTYSYTPAHINKILLLLEKFAQEGGIGASNSSTNTATSSSHPLHPLYNDCIVDFLLFFVSSPATPLGKGGRTGGAGGKLLDLLASLMERQGAGSEVSLKVQEYLDKLVRGGGSGGRLAPLIIPPQWWEADHYAQAAAVLTKEAAKRVATSPSLSAAEEEKNRVLQILTFILQKSSFSDEQVVQLLTGVGGGSVEGGGIFDQVMRETLTFLLSHIGCIDEAVVREGLSMRCELLLRCSFLHSPVFDRGENEGDGGRIPPREDFFLPGLSLFYHVLLQLSLPAAAATIGANAKVVSLAWGEFFGLLRHLHAQSNSTPILLFYSYIFSLFLCPAEGVVGFGNRIMGGLWGDRHLECFGSFFNDLEYFNQIHLEQTHLSMDDTDIIPNYEISGHKRVFSSSPFKIAFLTLWRLVLYGGEGDGAGSHAPPGGSLDLLLNAYDSFSNTNDPSAFSNASLLSLLFAILKRCSDYLKGVDGGSDGLVSDSGDGQGDRAMGLNQALNPNFTSIEDCEALTGRVLSILSHIIRHAYSLPSSCPPHPTPSSTQPATLPFVPHVMGPDVDRMSIFVHYKRVYHYSYPSSYGTSTYPSYTTYPSYSSHADEGGVLLLNLHPLTTIRMLKFKILASGRLPPKATVSFTTLRPPLNSTDSLDNCTLSDLDLADSHGVHITYEVTASSMSVGTGGRYTSSIDNDIYEAENVITEKVDLSDHILQILSEDITKFRILVDLANLPKGGFFASLWDILSLLPSQKDVAAFVGGVLDMSPYLAVPLWQEVFGRPNGVLDRLSAGARDGVVSSSPSHLLLTYYLTTLHTLLSPSEDIRGQIVGGDSSGQYYRDRFVDGGGVEQAIQLLLSLPPGGGMGSEGYKLLCGIVQLLNSLTNPPAPYPPLDLRVYLTTSSLSPFLSLCLYAAYRAAGRGGDGGAGDGGNPLSLVSAALKIVTAVMGGEEGGEISTTSASSPSSPPLVDAHYARPLILSLLLHPNEKIRILTKSFSVLLGRTSSGVLTWLTVALEGVGVQGEGVSGEVRVGDVGGLLRFGETRELFSALTDLLADFCRRPNAQEGREKAQLLLGVVAGKLSGYARKYREGGLERGGEMTALAWGEEGAGLGDLSGKEAPPFSLLLGYIQLYLALLQLGLGELQERQEREEMITTIARDYLFPLHTSPLCASPPTRSAAFQVLDYYAAHDDGLLQRILFELREVLNISSASLQGRFNVNFSYEVKSAQSNNYVGLKNMGCTCYLNSTLQMLYMGGGGAGGGGGFREVILHLPLGSLHRTTLHHLDPKELVGGWVLCEVSQPGNEKAGAGSLHYHHTPSRPLPLDYVVIGGTLWRTGRVGAYDSHSRYHTVQYFTLPASLPPTPFSSLVIEQETSFNLGEGRYRGETGRVRYLPPSFLGSSSNSNHSHPTPPHFFYHFQQRWAEVFRLTDKEVGQVYLMEQLQRIFVHLAHSNKRYYDPRPFIDSAVNVLRLNFSIFSQNDAAEFYDQLLDVLEGVMKGGSGQDDAWAVVPANVWNEVVIKHIFGGKYITQKIPQDCPAYDKLPGDCGHYRNALFESYLKIELQVRGKEGVGESLGEMIKGELFDGDNKLSCEDCQQKKSTLRRTMLSLPLPPVLVLHLKRFDLDFTTFEIVKLNSYYGFSQDLDLREYVGGMDEVVEGSDEAGEYVYELRGVLVHAGIAQGGHYYSFLRGEDEVGGGENSEANAEGGKEEWRGRWYKFDDDDVTPFPASQLPLHCFGGVQGGSGGGDRLEGEERSANALMLCYMKKSNRTDIKALMKSLLPTQTSASGPQYVSGLGAFLPEVRDQNLAHLSTCYARDPSLYSFFVGLGGGIGASVGASATGGVTLPPHSSPLVSLFTSQLTYLHNSLLHMRERPPLGGLVASLGGMMKVRGAGKGLAYLYLSSLLLSPHLQEGKGDYPTLPPNLFKVDWWSEYLGGGGGVDPRGREVFVSVLTIALTALFGVGGDADKEGDAYCPPTLPSLHDVKPSQLRASITQRYVGFWAAGASAEAAEVSPKEVGELGALFVRQLMEEVLRSAQHLRGGAEEVFLLLREVGAIDGGKGVGEGGETERVLNPLALSLQKMNIVSFLSYFLLPPSDVPPSIVPLFERHAKGGLRQGEVTPLLPCIYDAIASILGVPTSRPIPLLSEGGGWDASLTTPASEALTTVFFEGMRGVGGGAGGSRDYWDYYDLLAYMEKVGGGAGAVGAVGSSTGAVSKVAGQVKNILERYGERGDGGYMSSTSHMNLRLPLASFLRYQADMAAFSPRTVWRDLYAFGFRNDLTRPVVTSTPTLTASSHLPPLPSGPFPPLALSEGCLDLLGRVGFYEAGLGGGVGGVAGELGAGVRNILVRVCWGDELTSLSLIFQALAQLHPLLADSLPAYPPPALPLLTDFFKLLLCVDDGLLESRLRCLVWGEGDEGDGLVRGLGFMAIQEKDHPSRCRGNEGAAVRGGGLCDRYLGILQGVYGLGVHVSEGVQQLCVHAPALHRLKGMMRRPGSSLTLDEEEEVRNIVVTVRGAGSQQVDGQYVFDKMKCGAGSYVKLEEPGGNTGAAGRYMLYKCSMQQGGFNWFMSWTPEGKEPGTNKDVDYYCVKASGSDFLPPQHGWTRMAAAGPHLSAPQDPPPILTFLKGGREHLPPPPPSHHNHTHQHAYPPIIPDDSLPDISLNTSGFSGVGDGVVGDGGYESDLYMLDGSPPPLSPRSRGYSSGDAEDYGDVGGGVNSDHLYQ